MGLGWQGNTAEDASGRLARYMFHEINSEPSNEGGEACDEEGKH